MPTYDVMPEPFVFRGIVYAMSEGQVGYVYASAILVDTYNCVWIRRDAYVTPEPILSGTSSESHVQITRQGEHTYQIDVTHISHIWVPVESVDESKYLPIDVIVYGESDETA